MAEVATEEAAPVETPVRAAVDEEEAESGEKPPAKGRARPASEALPEADAKAVADADGEGFMLRRSMRVKQAVKEVVPTYTTFAKAETIIPVGAGTALRDIPAFKKHFDKAAPGDEVVKLFHKALYGAPGQQNVRKRNILKWSGCDEAHASEIEGRFNKAKMLSQLKALAQMCCLHQSGTKEDLSERLSSWLACPGAENMTRAPKEKKKKGKSVKKGIAKKGKKKDPDAPKKP